MGNRAYCKNGNAGCGRLYDCKACTAERKSSAPAPAPTRTPAGSADRPTA